MTINLTLLSLGRILALIIVTGVLGNCARREQTPVEQSGTVRDENFSALEPGYGEGETNAAEFDALVAEFRDGNLEAAVAAFNLAFQSTDPMMGRRQIAAEVLQESALAGHAQSQFILGQLLADGRLLRKDPEASRYWLLLAAQQGHQEAQKSIALSFVMSALDSKAEEEKELSRSNAIHWLRIAMERGDLNSKALLGELYSERENTREEGLRLLREAAADGSNHATEVLQVFDEIFGDISN